MKRLLVRAGLQLEQAFHKAWLSGSGCSACRVSGVYLQPQLEHIFQDERECS